MPVMLSSIASIHRALRFTTKPWLRPFIPKMGVLRFKSPLMGSVRTKHAHSVAAELLKNEPLINTDFYTEPLAISSDRENLREELLDSLCRRSDAAILLLKGGARGGLALRE